MNVYGAGLLIYRPRDGRVLMTRRAASESSPGYWDFAGGSVEEGETELEAALREGREELGGLPGLHVDTEPVLWTPNPSFAFATFLAQMDAASDAWEPVLNEEHDQYGWFYPTQLPTPSLEGAIASVRHFFHT